MQGNNKNPCKLNPRISVPLPNGRPRATHCEAWLRGVWVSQDDSAGRPDRSHRPQPSHGRGRWFNPSIAHQPDSGQLAATRQGSLVQSQHRPPTRFRPTGREKPMIFMGFFVSDPRSAASPPLPKRRTDSGLCPICGHSVPKSCPARDSNRGILTPAHPLAEWRSDNPHKVPRPRPSTVDRPIFSNFDSRRARIEGHGQDFHWRAR